MLHNFNHLNLFFISLILVSFDPRIEFPIELQIVLNLFDLIKLVLSIRYNLIRRSMRSKRLVSFVWSRLSRAKIEIAWVVSELHRETCKFNLASLCNGRGAVKIGSKLCEFQCIIIYC